MTMKSFINYAGKNIRIQTSVLLISVVPQYKGICASQTSLMENAHSTPIIPTISYYHDSLTTLKEGLTLSVRFPSTELTSSIA